MEIAHDALRSQLASLATWLRSPALPRISKTPGAYPVWEGLEPLLGRLAGRRRRSGRGPESPKPRPPVANDDAIDAARPLFRDGELFAQ
jgi:hypothetical protein